MRFSTRITLTVGLSTLLLTSLYWLVGWHYVEQIERRQQDALTRFIARQADRIASGELSSEVLQLLPGERLYRAEESWPAAWPNTTAPGQYPLADDSLLLVRNSVDGPIALHLPALDSLLVADESEQVEAFLAIGGVLLFSIGAMGLSLWLIWRQTQPVRRLMQAVAAVDPAAPVLEPLARQDELGALSRQFAELLMRTRAFIRREQNFTRFASHELRTPLMTLRSSLALLEEMAAAEGDAPMRRRALQRSLQALARMEQLTDSFLWLSRERQDPQCRVDETALRALLDQLQALNPALSPRLQLDWQAAPDWPIHPFVLSVVLDNLLRNALEHGAGAVRLSIEPTGVQVVNALAGAAATTPAGGTHFGYGLPIVEQLCDKAGARFAHRIEAGQFIAEVRFSPSGAA